MRFDKFGDHIALSIAYGRHVDGEVATLDTKFFAATKKRGDLGAMDDILARQASNVGARTSDVPALDYGDPLTLFR